MKGIPRLPPLSSLPREQVEQIESFIEKYELGVSLGKIKTAKFILNIYNEEEAKRKKKEKYSRKLLKDAEKLILSMQVSPARRSHIEPAGTAPARKKDFSKQRGGSEERQSETREDRIRRRLRSLLKSDHENAEKLVQMLLKRKDGEALAAHLGKMPGLLEKADLGSMRERVGMLGKAEELFRSASRLESLNMAEEAALKYREAAAIFKEWGPVESAAQLYEKAVELYKKSAGLKLSAKEAAEELERAKRALARAKSGREIGAIGDIGAVKAELVAKAEERVSAAEQQLAAAEEGRPAKLKRASIVKRAIQRLRALGKKKAVEPEKVMTPEGKKVEVPQEQAEWIGRVERDRIFKSAIIDPGMRNAIGLGRGRDLAESAWAEIYRGEAEPAFRTELEKDAYHEMGQNVEKSFLQVAEYAWNDTVAEKTRIPKRKRQPSKVSELEVPVYLRMKKVFGAIWEANAARKEMGKKKIQEIVEPAEIAEDYRGYFQQGAGMPREMLEQVRRMGIETRIAYDGKNVTGIKEPSAIITVGDLHGDHVSPATAFKQAGFIIDTRPDLGVSDASVSPKDRYVLNREIAQGTQFVFLGDYIDRGPRNLYAVDFVQWLKAEVERLGNGSHVHTLRGNHEAIFMRVYHHYRGKSTAEVKELIESTEKCVEYDRERKVDKFREIYGRPPLSELIAEGIALENVGMETTLRGILERYGTWEEAVVEMEKPGGLVHFIRNTKTAVLMESAEGNSLFAHAGPVVKTPAREADGAPIKSISGHIMYDEITDLEMLDKHYAYFFGDAEGKLFGEKLNSWMQNGVPTDRAVDTKFREEYNEAGYSGDYSDMYVGFERRGGWKPTENNAEVVEKLDILARNLGLVSINVGHHRKPRTEVVAFLEAGDRKKLEVVNNDSSLSEAYLGNWEEWEGGIQHKLAWGVAGEKNRIIMGRKDAPGNVVKAPGIERFEAPIEIENGYSSAWQETLGRKIEEGEAEDVTATMAVTVPSASVPNNSAPKAKTLAEMAQEASTKSTGAKTLGELAAERAAPTKSAPAKTLGELAAAEAARQTGIMPKRPTEEDARRALERRKAATAGQGKLPELPGRLGGWVDAGTGLSWPKLKEMLESGGHAKNFSIPIEIEGVIGKWEIRLEGITKEGGKELYWYTVSKWPAEIEYTPGQTTGAVGLGPGQSLREEIIKNIRKSFETSGSRRLPG